MGDLDTRTGQFGDGERAIRTAVPPCHATVLAIDAIITSRVKVPSHRRTEEADFPTAHLGQQHAHNLCLHM